MRANCFPNGVTQKQSRRTGSLTVKWPEAPSTKPSLANTPINETSDPGRVKCVVKLTVGESKALLDVLALLVGIGKGRRVGAD